MALSTIAMQSKPNVADPPSYGPTGPLFQLGNKVFHEFRIPSGYDIADYGLNHGNIQNPPPLPILPPSYTNNEQHVLPSAFATSSIFHTDNATGPTKVDAMASKTSSTIEKKKKSAKSSAHDEDEECRKRLPNWTVTEDVALTKAYIRTSEDPVTGIAQTAATFWNKVESLYTQYLNDNKGSFPIRPASKLDSRWKIISKCVQLFNGHYTRATSKPLSGTNEADYVDLAKRLYEKAERKKFEYEHCWKILLQCPKWKGVVKQNVVSSKKPKLHSTQEETDLESLFDTSMSKNKKAKTEVDLLSSPSNSVAAKDVCNSHHEHDAMNMSKRPIGNTAAKRAIAKEKALKEKQKATDKMTQAIERTSLLLNEQLTADRGEKKYSNALMKSERNLKLIEILHKFDFATSLALLI